MHGETLKLVHHDVNSSAEVFLVAMPDSQEPSPLSPRPIWSDVDVERLSSSQKRWKSPGAKRSEYGGWGNTSDFKFWIFFTVWQADVRGRGMSCCRHLPEDSHSRRSVRIARLKPIPEHIKISSGFPKHGSFSVFVWMIFCSFIFGKTDSYPAGQRVYKCSSMWFEYRETSLWGGYCNAVAIGRNLRRLKS